MLGIIGETTKQLPTSVKGHKNPEPSHSNIRTFVQNIYTNIWVNKYGM